MFGGDVGLIVYERDIDGSGSCSTLASFHGSYKIPHVIFDVILLIIRSTSTSLSTLKCKTPRKMIIISGSEMNYLAVMLRSSGGLFTLYPSIYILQIKHRSHSNVRRYESDNPSNIPEYPRSIQLTILFSEQHKLHAHRHRRSL